MGKLLLELSVHSDNCLYSHKFNDSKDKELIIHWQRSLEKKKKKKCLSWITHLFFYQHSKEWSTFIIIKVTRKEI